MKATVGKLGAITAALSIIINTYTQSNVIYPTYLAFRSQSFNDARTLSGVTHLYFPVEPTDSSCTISLTPAYTRMFNNKDILCALFGRDVSKCGIKISGSNVTDRGECDWLADNFYLPPDFESTIRLEPHIDNFLLNVGWFMSLDSWVEGLYIQLDVPIVRTRWQLERCETVTNVGSQGYDTGYFTPNSVTRDHLLDSFSSYLCGSYPDTTHYSFPAYDGPGGLENISYTVTYNPLCHAQMTGCAYNTTRAADLRTTIGWNHFGCPCFDWGVKALVCAPTGNRPKGCVIFEPIAGNGHHWEIGAGGRMRWRLWCPDDEEQWLALYLDGHINHMFSASQHRTFDICGKPFSRYMLAARYGTAAYTYTFSDATREIELKGSGESTNRQFRQEYTPVANLSTIQVDVKTAIQGQLTAMLEWICRGFVMNAGYNFWGRTCEKVRVRCQGPLDTTDRPWGLKGDARMFGFLSTDSDNTVDPPATPTTLQENTPISLSATQCGATIYTGLNDDSLVNAKIDNPQLATEGVKTGVVPATPTPLYNYPTTMTGAAQINTSIQPIFIVTKDLQTCDSGTTGLSHKLFAHIGHTWIYCSPMPTIGIGGEVEWGQNSCDPCGCAQCALSQWGCWLKGCLTF